VARLYRHALALETACPQAALISGFLTKNSNPIT
jgi:hypothetical protein